MVIYPQKAPFPSMEDITVDPNGVQALLSKLNIHKASEPDGLKLGYLKNVVLKLLLCWPTSSMSHLLKELYQMTDTGKCNSGF